ncbi:jg20132 [Pararge aegeria aegeria]|uniref:Jg20132 protein n=1 Tax=Pararge aegeria aegeria TaxID=348720 RepID=A0A8S4S9S6_9NEOP|nr:jg20132 [Pararge aegeria aegeria]
MMVEIAVFYKIHFGDCAQELFHSVELSPFYHRTAWHRKNLLRYVVEIRTKRFASDPHRKGLECPPIFRLSR